jgi:hypothetical protein
MNTRRARTGLARFEIPALLTLLGLAACGGGSGGGGGTAPNPPSTTYSGFLTADDGSSAGLALTFASAVAIRSGEARLAAPVAVTGVATLVGGGTVNLSGSVDAGNFTATGGGLTLTGTLESGVINGRFTGPSGLGGGFAAVSTSASHPVYVFCGRYTGTLVEGGTESGNFHALVSGKDLVGDILPDGFTADGSLTGFLGAAAAQTDNSIKVSVDIVAGDESLTADGTINAAKDAVGGTYSKRFPGLAGQSSDGNFSGAKCPGT